MKMNLKEKNRLLRVRTTKKKQRPSFARFESWRYKKLSKSGWRKQRGIDNKTRRKTKNGVVSPEPGFGSPKNIRGLHPSGLEDILVMHVKELETLDPKFHAIRIAARLGARKKLNIVEIAREQGFRVLNSGLGKDEMLDLEDVEEEEETDEEMEDEESESQPKSKRDQIKKLKEKKPSEEEETEDSEEVSE
ncbi:hypothetical protein NEF87_003551 [Candidatus Lokiarchaeum ossiferum]|uniref:Large ribosomal subunit protein eL32 n=1 Tax=Candidatus Lokiarchaeum ossiferum TaxID=2951803 RepID=A0ABY6HXH2_9ARCH|nr:hypothetical protein NEF87_003551 [Candidatus Lokiarchaeum sp. B-35]